MKLIYKIVTVFLLSTMIVMGTKFNAQTLVSNKSDDNIWFSMKIYGEQTNSWTDARWRQTDSVDNKWKVDFQNSNEEGAEYTITTFWLEHTNGTNVSDAHDVKEGTGAHYYTPRESANESYVRLTAENNDFDFNSYSISGYWDEETW